MKPLHSWRWLLALPLLLGAPAALPACGEEGAPEHPPATRIAEVRVVWRQGGKQVESEARFSFIPGRPAELEIASTDQAGVLTRFVMTIRSHAGEPMQHEFAVVIREERPLAKPRILAEPTIVVAEGRPGSLESGGGENGVQVHLVVTRAN